MLHCTALRVQLYITSALAVFRSDVNLCHFKSYRVVQNIMLHSSISMELSRTVGKKSFFLWIVVFVESFLPPTMLRDSISTSGTLLSHRVRRSSWIHVELTKVMVTRETKTLCNSCTTFWRCEHILKIGLVRWEIKHSLQVFCFVLSDTFARTCSNYNVYRRRLCRCCLCHA